MQEASFRAMGCAMLVQLDAQGPATVAPLAAVPAWFAACERQLSRFRSDSALTLLNEQAGRLVPVEPILWEMVQIALEAAAASGGLVTPLALPALEAAGYWRSLEALASGAAAPPLSAADQRVGDWRQIVIERYTRSVRLPAGSRLDLGGMAKGWAADRAAAWLGLVGPALIDAGGDIAVSGPRADGTPWSVAVADPVDETAPDLALLRLTGGGVATSARTYRRWRQQGVWQHHIIDPRSGRPAETDLLSVTVVAPSAVAAEVAAKTVLILGRAAGLAWLEQRPTLAGLLVLSTRELVTSQQWVRRQQEE